MNIISQELRKPFEEKDLNRVEGEDIVTVNPQAIIDRLESVFGVGCARLEVLSSGPVKEDVIAVGVRRPDNGKIEVISRGKVVIDSPTFQWESSVRTKGFFGDASEPVGNIVNACESLLWATCCRELGIGGDLYYKTTVKLQPIKAHPKAIERATQASISASEASSQEAEEPPTPPVDFVEPPEQDPIKDEYQDAILSELDKRESAKEMMDFLAQYNITDEEIKLHFKLKRLGQAKIREYVELVLTGQIVKGPNEPQKEEAESDEEEVDTQNQDNDNEEAKEEQAKEEAQEDLESFVLGEDEKRSVPEAAKIVQSFNKLGLNAAVYEDFLSQVDVPDERLADYNQVFKYANDKWLQRLEDFLK